MKDQIGDKNKNNSMKIKKFNEDLETPIDKSIGEVDFEKAMENRKISDLTVKEFKELIRMIVSSELSKTDR